MSVTTITTALVIASNPLKFGRNDGNASTVSNRNANVTTGVARNAWWDADTVVGFYHLYHVHNDIPLFHGGGHYVDMSSITPFW